MIHYGLTIDPGLENGICLFSYGDTEPLKIERLWQFPGGAVNLGKWVTNMGLRLVGGDTLVLDTISVPLTALVVEKFTPRPHESFSLTLKSVEPLRGEGVLLAHGLDDVIQWREPSAQYFMGGEDLADKKKRARAFLKKYGMLPTGKVVSRPDANDAISATLHTVAWLRRTRHMPTIEALFPGLDLNSLVMPELSEEE